MSLRIRVLGKIVFWGTFFVLTCSAGVLGFAYWYVTDSETLASLIKAETPRFLPGSLINLKHVRLWPFRGEIELEQVHVRQKIDGSLYLTLKLPWLHIRHDPRAMLKRQFVPREVVVAQPTLRLRRRKDGTWNIQGLLADPWPGPPMKGTPPILIQNGTVELSDPNSPEGATAAILREVALQIKPAEGNRLTFEGSARGDSFDRLSLRGTIDMDSGRVSLAGDLERLEITDTLRSRLPIEVRAPVERLGLTGGEVDVRVGSVTYDPAATPAIHYDLGVQVRAGVWGCPKLPFPINDLSASVALRDGELTIERAEGYNGSTTVRAEKSRIVLGDPATAPLDLHLTLIDLELDRRLRDHTPPEFLDLWRDFSPRGRISAAINVVRAREGSPLLYAWTVDCRDVAMLYRFFKYPLDHVRGTIQYEKDRIGLKLQTLVGGKPLIATGTIDHPGPLAHVQLDFQGEALPIDKTLLDAIPPDIRTVVDQFHPTGTVRGSAHVDRTPPAKPADPAEGIVRIDAVLDLNERCAIRWDGMPYPVSNLTGRLELHPDRWKFTNMRGSNGQAVITGSGLVEKLAGPGNPLAVDLELHAQKLPFDDQLRLSLPPAWQKTWATLNPIGSSDVDVRIRVRPGQPDHYHLELAPLPETGVRLEFTRAASGSDPGGTFDLRMEDVHGRFIFDDGPVDMHDVSFQFHGSPVRFARGRVVVENSGRFNLGVAQVEARNFRLDQDLRKKMPPLMRQFARRIDDGRTFAMIKGNLGLSWSGQDGQPVLCRWDDTLVVFNDNAIQAGLPLEHLQGQLDHVQGKFDGADLTVDGALRLESVNLMGQQLTALESPFHVGRGVAQLSNIQGKLLGGLVSGQLEVSLDATPRYAARLALDGADLERYANTVQGRQTFRGLVSVRAEFNGLGSDLRTLQGRGEAHVVNGDLGELPVLLRLVKTLNLSSATKTAFDSADVVLRVQNGQSVLDPIKLTGNAFSLVGQGTMGIQGVIDMRLTPVYGRDRLHVPILSDVMREASGRLFVIRAQGPIAYPQFKLEPLPVFTDFGRSISSRRSPRADRMR